MDAVFSILICGICVLCGENRGKVCEVHKPNDGGRKSKNPEAEASGSGIKPTILLQGVSRRERAQRAGRVRADSGTGIGATGRARRHTARRVQLDVGRQVGRIGDGVSRLLALFQRELVGRRVNLAEVVDAGIGLRGGTGFHEVRNRDGRQEADNGHDAHDFHQGETRFADVFGLFHFVLLSVYAAELRIRLVYMITTLFP